MPIRRRNAGGEATLSRFLTGVTIADPVTGSRAASTTSAATTPIYAIVCPDPQVTAAARRAALRRGSSRVH